MSCSLKSLDNGSGASLKYFEYSPLTKRKSSLDDDLLFKPRVIPKQALTRQRTYRTLVPDAALVKLRHSLPDIQDVNKQAWDAGSRGPVTLPTMLNAAKTFRKIGVVNPSQQQRRTARSESPIPRPGTRSMSGSHMRRAISLQGSRRRSPDAKNYRRIVAQPRGKDASIQKIGTSA